ncbi:endonuclease domain-containing 1 protein-like [Hoplias malabaricus]|uniref:endonuclease domain-containing 1 protein-like n=1 Tax=Hoplias malabaricus TaxID=27720 RepID=UPI00346246C8
MDKNGKKICQRYASTTTAFFASLYSERHRIPLYSAYIFHPECSDSSIKYSKFFIEPQLSGESEQRLSPESQFNVDQIKQNQAINGYYAYTDYDRGQLNPSSAQCGKGRDATFTLTNVAPMDAAFYRHHWYKVGKEMNRMLTTELQQNPAATPYLITGTIPQANYRIPRKEKSAQDEQREYEKVTVPSHVWTALCFKHPTDNKESFSLGYIGQNQPDSSIEMMSVRDLNNKLTELYDDMDLYDGKIFVDDCFPENEKSQEMVKSLYTNVQLQSLQQLQMTPNLLKMYETALTLNFASEKPVVTEMTISLFFDSVYTFSEQTEKMKYVSDTACLLTSVKRNASSELLECKLAPEESKTEDGSGVNCTSACLYNKETEDYRCYSKQNLVKCSPLYSAITVQGEKCKADHPCGIYGWSAYWCYKESGEWYYCSPPVWETKAQSGDYCRANYACSKYGEALDYCYTTKSDEKQKCCNRDDCFTAVDGKTCKSDHPCSYYGESYLWCYTTDGSWAYCCKNCW